MNPIMKCCGYYCSCVIVFSFAFFGILIYLINSGNQWITRDFHEAPESRVQAITIAMIVNAVCLVGCVGCLKYNAAKEEEERVRAERDEDDNIELK
jgi:hypothetical protein